MRYERPLKATLLAALSRPTPVIHVLIGPRQVGKTTIARQIRESIDIPTIYASADSPVPFLDCMAGQCWVALRFPQPTGTASRLSPGIMVP